MERGWGRNNINILLIYEILKKISVKEKKIGHQVTEKQKLNRKAKI